MKPREPERPETIPGVELGARRRRDGSVYAWSYRVCWQDPATGKRLVEICGTAEEALDFKAQLRLLTRRGALAEMGRLTVAEMVVRWWHDYASAELTHRTLAAYKVIWELHLLSRVGHLQVRQVTPLVVTRLRNDLHDDGVGAATIRKGLGMLQAVWRQAIEWGEANDNPFRVVRKPRAPRKITVVPFTVEQVERMRDFLAERHGPDDAALISLLAYAGPRPEDALAAEFRHVGKGTLLLEQKNVDGVIVPGAKTGERSRSVDLLRHLRQDLIELRLRAGNPAGDTLLFRRADGEPWREYDYRNWRTRHFKPAAREVGMPAARPYDLRHTYASLLIAQQRLSLREIADQMGNSLATLASTYAHVIADLKGQPPVDPDRLIAQARRRTPRPGGRPAPSASTTGSRRASQ